MKDKHTKIWLAPCSLCCKLLIFGLAMLFAVPAAFAGTTGKIVGTVTDQETNEPLPGVNVILEGTTMGAATDLEGYFMVLHVPPGVYTLRATMIGYQSKRIENLKVSVDLTTTQNFKLGMTVLDIGEEVTVVAERPIIQKDMTSSLASVGTEEISAMPVQELADVLELQAGLVRDAYGGMHVRGGRAGEVAYWVDGIAATDGYSGNLGVEIENNSVQELQVISGTFNAEYGQAMSAIVNIVTKDGGPEYHGEVSWYVGDYMSFNDDTYFVIKPNYYYLPNIMPTKVPPSLDAIRAPQNGTFSKINPLRKINPIFNIQASLSGPILSDKLTFFATSRYFYNEGYLYGLRWFTPQGLMGDCKTVSLHPFRKFSGQAKVAYKLTPSMKLTYGLMGNSNKFRWFNSYFKYNPDGDYQRFENALNHILTFTHMVSANTFYEVKFTNSSTDYKHYVYKDPRNGVAYDADYYDPSDTTKVRYTVSPKDPEGYIHPDSLISPASWSFSDGGAEMQHFKRNTSYTVGKFDLTSQVTKNHQIKTGMEARFHDLTLEEFNIIPKKKGNDELRPFQPEIPDLSTAQHNRYDHKPIELSAYIQDKMEFKDMIVNFGLRFDYFDPDGVVHADPKDPNIHDPFKKEHKYSNWDSSLPDSELVETTLEEREKYWWKKAEKKYQISPRFGIAYPITDRGVIHFSYGHFFQMPSFKILYGASEGGDQSNPDLEVSRTSGNSTFLSNADLKPQKTVMYELGLQQQLTEDVGFDITMFYRDVRDWVGASPLVNTYLASVAYTKFENKDYSNVRGVTLALNKRYSNYFEASLDYSFMVVEGSASNTQDAYFDRQSDRSPRIQLIPLSWDQRHTINATVSVGTTTWRISLLGRYWTGTPYTPEFAIGEVAGTSAFSGLQENSARKPNISSFDLRLYKQFPVGSLKFSVFAYVYNLFDQRGTHNVWSDTGSPVYTLSTRSASADEKRVSTLEDNTSRPEWFVEPCQVQVGVSVGF